ncbi:MAG: Spy/CpxP family protein refolding chaperone [Nitrospinota bacterium]
MKRWAKWTILALTLLLAGGLVAGVTLADSGHRFQKAHWERGGGHRGWGHGDYVGRMKKKLELTDEQTGKIRNAILEARKKGVKVRADLRVARIELGQLLTQTEVDRGAVDQKISEISQIGQGLFRHWTDTFFQIREVLTPEQREKAKPFIQRIVSRHPGRFHGGMGRGGRHGG